MTTKNLVPRTSGQGQIGTSAKKWSNANFVTGTFDNLTVNGQSITGSLQADSSSVWALTSDNLSLYPHGITDGVVSTGVFALELNSADVLSSQNITIEELVNALKGMNVLTTTNRSSSSATDDYFEFDGTTNVMPKDLS